jgi:hypothetical protein
MAQPGILPSYGNVLEITAVLDVGTIIVAGLYRLMLAYWK